MEVTARGADGAAPASASWMVRARCRAHDPEVFFVRSAAQSRRAVRICSRCDVRAECLGYALRNDIEFGIWGGMTERQRRRQARMTASR